MPAAPRSIELGRSNSPEATEYHRMMNESEDGTGNGSGSANGNGNGGAAGAPGEGPATPPPPRSGSAYPATQYVNQQHGGGQRPPIAPGTPLGPPLPMASPAYTAGTGGASDRSTAGTYCA